MMYHELSYLIIKQLEEILDVSISNGDQDMLIPTENKLEEFHRRSCAMLVILRRKAKDYETSLQCNGDTGNDTDDSMSDSMKDITQKVNRLFSYIRTFQDNPSDASGHDS